MTYTLDIQSAVCYSLQGLIGVMYLSMVSARCVRSNVCLIFVVQSTVCSSRESCCVYYSENVQCILDSIVEGMSVPLFDGT